MLQWLDLLANDPASAEARVLKELLRESPEVADWSAAVQPVLVRLVGDGPARTPIVCRVLDMPVFNALALPHRTIVLSQLLVDFCRDRRDEMAFVIAHELAHIHLGHARKRMVANTMMTVAPLANPLLGMGLRWLFDRAYTREQEFEADGHAVRLCTRAGYASSASMTLLQRLASMDTPRNLVSQLLGTHPPVADRIQQIANAIAAAG